MFAKLPFQSCSSYQNYPTTEQTQQIPVNYYQVLDKNHAYLIRLIDTRKMNGNNLEKEIIMLSRRPLAVFVRKQYF